MIVAICGAYKNAGDHLIGKRARALLRGYVDSDIVTVDRRSIAPKHYELFNRARAIVLCGGPAYQRKMYPDVYPLEREKIVAPIVPFGLGWKSPAKKAPETFKFEAEAVDFIRDIHAGIELSSARDPLTVDVLGCNGIHNVLMTGCPAWYDPDFLETPYAFAGEPHTVVLSMPAVMQPGVYELMLWLTHRFAKARRVVSFHHGVIPGIERRGREKTAAFMKFSAAAMMRGWRISSLAGSLSRLETFYGAADLHVGYRVHAHLFCLSRRIPSILVNEDSRGVGQAKALGTPSLLADSGSIEPIQRAVEDYFATRGERVAHSVETMRETFTTMRRFLATL